MNINKVSQFIHSNDFYRSLKGVIGIIIPLISFKLLGYPEIGLQIMSGALLVMGLDISVNFIRKAKLMGLAAVINTFIILVNVVISELDGVLALFLFIVLFTLSYISLFSDPFKLMTIFATIAILISMGLADGIDSFQKWLSLGAFTLTGSMWYFIYAFLLHYILYPSSVARSLRRSLQLTEAFLLLQADLLHYSSGSEEAMKRHLKVRSALIDQKRHIEQLLSRELSFIYQRKRNVQQIFPALETLIHIWDHALGHSFDFDQLKENCESNDIVCTIEQNHRLLASEASRMVRLISVTGLFFVRKKVEWKSEVTDFLDNISWNDSYLIDGIIHYQCSIRDSLKELGNRLSSRESYEVKEIPLSFNTRLYEPDLSWKRLSRYLNWNSRAFRHAFRIAFVGVAGFFIGRLFHLSNPSWILLTSVVILNPDYRTTKQRFWLRVIGTMIGVIVGLGIHLLDPGPYGMIMIFALSLQVAFSFLNVNYAVSSALFSVFILFLYSYRNIDFMESAIFRVIDTLIGALLAFLAIRFGITFWEHQTLKRRVMRSLAANKNWMYQFRLLGMGATRIEERQYDLHQERAYARQQEMDTAISRMSAEPLRHRNLLQSYEAFLFQNERLLMVLSALGERLRYHGSGTEFFTVDTQQKIWERLNRMIATWVSEVKYSSVTEERIIMEPMHSERFGRIPIINENEMTDDTMLSLYFELDSALDHLEKKSAHLRIAFLDHTKNSA